MTDDKPAIAFIGLGLMGAAFTRRLIERGYAVTGYDIVAEKVRAAAEQGVRPAASAAEAAAAADIVLICVTATQAVEAAVFGPGGIAEAADGPKVVVDHSTTEVTATKRMAERLAAETGAAWVDAPVSGGPSAAAGGSLAIMAGGTDAAVARIEPVMADLAAKFTHFGPVGAGQVAKLINQVLVLTNYCVIAEALKLAEDAGIDAVQIPAALADGHAGSNLLGSLYPRMQDRDFRPLGFARQVLKDLDMVQDFAKSLKTPTPMAAQAANLFRLLVSRGHGELDGAAIFKLYDDPPV